MKRALIGTGIVIALVIVGVALWLTLTDFSKYRPNIEEAFAEATGRDLTIGGDFVIEIFPPAIVAEQVTYANAEWASDAPFVSVGHLSAGINAGVFFGGPIVVEYFRLRDVELLLEENEDGEVNWSIEQEEDPVPPGVEIEASASRPLVVKSAELENITVRQRRPGEEERVIVVSSLNASTDEGDMLRAEGGGEFDGQNISLNATMGPLANIGTGNEMTLDLEVWIDDLTAVANVRHDGERYNFDVNLSALELVGELAGASGLPAGPASSRGTLLLDGNQIGLIDVTVDTSAIDLTTSLNAVIGDQRIVLDPFALQVGESDVAGSLDIGTGETISVAGNIRSKLIDLTELAPKENAQAPAAQEPAPEKGEFVLSDEPLPFEFLNAGSVDLDLLVETFRNGPIEMRQIEGKVLLQDGSLTVDGGLAVADGGNADANITLASAGDSATLDMDFELSDFRLRAAEGSEISVEDIPLVGLSLDIESSGNSVHSLAAASNGKVILTQGPGKVDNRAVGFFSKDILAELFSTLNPFAKDEPYSNWECTVVGVDLVDGVGTLKPLLAQGEKLTIVADGKVDFSDESLDFSFNTKPRKGVGISADMFLTPFVRLGGTMASPKLALDKSGVLIEGGAAFLTGGMSFLVKGAADRATGGADRCDAALAIARGEDVEAVEGS
jgi:uncharacterized protein involved in outer membrane biogenesis